MNLKKTTLNLLFVGLILISGSLYSQENENIIRCASDEHNAELLKQYPKMMGSNAYEEILSKQIKANKSRINQRGGVVYVIPVVVHVLHNGEALGVGPNISDAQVLSQIKVLNDDFRKMIGTNGHNSHADGADIEVEFCLALQAPDGCPTTGINRINIGQNGISELNLNNATVQMDALKPSSIWDASSYMNMWSVAFNGGSGLLGYAQFPGGAADTDGVVADYRYFGSDDDPNVTLSGDFNLGRTMTHEVGHYLGLYHTFQGGCAESGGGDLCTDTPAVASSGSNSSVCNTGNDSCPAGTSDMVENYMDYSTDVCMNVFTNDQKARIISTITTASNRPTTISSNVCNPVASVNDDGGLSIDIIDVEDCSLNVTPAIRITNWGTNTLTSGVVTYDVDGGASSNYNWAGSLDYGEFEVVNLPTMLSPEGKRTLNATFSSPNASTDLRSCNNSVTSDYRVDKSFNSTTQVHFTLNTDSTGGETTWEFRDSGNNLLYSGGPHLDNSTFNQTFNVIAGECYKFTIFDSFGDGICCGLFGDGSYELKADDDSLIATGGAFGVSETSNVSTISFLSENEYFINNEISLFPNPSKDFINIKLANNDLPDAYKVYNMLGQLMTERNVDNASHLKIDTSRFSNGMYFIKVYKNGSSKSLPFIKK